MTLLSPNPFPCKACNDTLVEYLGGICATCKPAHSLGFREGVNHTARQTIQELETTKRRLESNILI